MSTCPLSGLSERHVSTIILLLHRLSNIILEVSVIGNELQTNNAPRAKAPRKKTARIKFSFGTNATQTEAPWTKGEQTAGDRNCSDRIFLDTCNSGESSQDKSWAKASRTKTTRTNYSFESIWELLVSYAVPSAPPRWPCG